MVERLDLVRYIMIGGSITSCFINLIDEINKGAGLLRVLFYSGSLLLIAVLLILIDKKIMLPVIFYISGVLMLMGDLEPGRVSACISLFGFGTYLANNKYVNLSIYLIVAIVVTASHVFKGGSPEDLINILVAYAVFFALNELIYKKRQDDVKAGG